MGIFHQIATSLRKLSVNATLLAMTTAKVVNNKQSFSSNKNLSFAQNLDSRDARIKQSLRFSATSWLAGLKEIFNSGSSQNSFENFNVYLYGKKDIY